MRGKRSRVPSNYILIILIIACVASLFISYATGFSGGPIQIIADYVFVPMQRGIDLIGSSISVSSEDSVGFSSDEIFFSVVGNISFIWKL